jgi:hypothetical protein
MPKRKTLSQMQVEMNDTHAIEKAKVAEKRAKAKKKKEEKEAQTDA